MTTPKRNNEIDTYTPGFSPTDFPVKKTITIPASWFHGLLRRMNETLEHVDDPRLLPYHVHGLAGYISSIELPQEE